MQRNYFHEKIFRHLPTIVILGIICFQTNVHSHKKEEFDKPQKFLTMAENTAHMYSDTVKDSIIAHYSIGDNRNLRKLDTIPTVLLRKEKLVYDGGWEFVRGGYVILKTDIDTVQQLIKITAKAFTNSVTSAFYSLSDIALTEMDPHGLYPLYFEQFIQENRFVEHNWYFYDNIVGKVYTNGRSEKPVFSTQPFSHNYLSLFHYLRSLSFSPKDTFSIRCFVHGKDYPIFFQVIAKETITVTAGTFQCLKMEPRLVGEGRGFTKKDKMCLWVTDDNYHMLVQATSKVAIGRLSLKLLAYERD